jgi:hypothetical protein
MQVLTGAGTGHILGICYLCQVSIDDTQLGNPNRTPEMLMFSITRARGRLQGGPKAITDTVGEGGDTMICGEGDRGGLKIYRVV